MVPSGWSAEGLGCPAKAKPSAARAKLTGRIDFIRIKVFSVVVAGFSRDFAVEFALKSLFRIKSNDPLHTRLLSPGTVAVRTSLPCSGSNQSRTVDRPPGGRTYTLASASGRTRSSLRHQ
jgi:hypothetical protein